MRIQTRLGFRFPCIRSECCLYYSLVPRPSISKQSQLFNLHVYLNCSLKCDTDQISKHKNCACSLSIKVSPSIEILYAWLYTKNHKQKPKKVQRIVMIQQLEPGNSRKASFFHFTETKLYYQETQCIRQWSSVSGLYISIMHGCTGRHFVAQLCRWRVSK